MTHRHSRPRGRGWREEVRRWVVGLLGRVAEKPGDKVGSLWGA